MIKRGDVVILKGNPKVKMNVQDIYSNSATLIWFDESHNLQTKEFDLSLLEVAEYPSSNANESLLLG